MPSQAVLLHTFAFLAVLVNVAVCVQTSQNWPRSSYCGRLPVYTPAVNLPDADMSLVFVQAIFRHGDRLPISHCWDHDNEWQCILRHEERMNSNALSNLNVARLHRKNYINGKNINPGNCASGALTNVGYHQHVGNGQYLRDAYINHNSLLPAALDVSKILVRSTDYPRTFASVEGLLAGLYPLASQVQTTQFVNISTVDGDLEFMYPSSTFCPRAGEYKQQFIRSAAYQNHLASVTMPLIADLERALNVKITAKPNDAINNLFDCFQAHLCHNFSLPSSITYDLYERVVSEQTYFYGSTYNYPDRVSAGKTGMGMMLSEVVSQFSDAMANKTQFKLSLWSGHDTTVMPFLNALGAWDKVWAPYASLITMELWKSPANMFYVRLLYQGAPLKMPGCSGGVFCPWSDFESLVRPLLLTNVAQDCAVSSTAANDVCPHCVNPLD